MVPLCRAIAFTATFTSVLALNRVDTHIHALPPMYLAAVKAAGGDPSGFPTPNWTLDAAIGSMNQLNTDIGILSLSTPGVPIAGTGKTGRVLARSMNDFFGNSTIDVQYSRRLGFFGVLPDWRDVSGTLAELDYLFQTQQLCNGVTTYTTYGDKLLGDPLFVPIWERLQEYKALVFVHPGVLDIKPKLIASRLAQPIVDYPLATTRAAVDLVMSQTVRRCPDVDIILAHAGGTLPFIGDRAIGSLAIPEIAETVGYNLLQARSDFRRFYYDIALSTSDAQLHGLLDFADASHLLFGSDFPYVSQVALEALLVQYSAFVAKDERGYMVSPERLSENSMKLLKKHAMKKTF